MIKTLQNGNFQFFIHIVNENQREVLVETTKYAKEQLVVNPPLQHIKVKKAMESILTESERTELSRLLNKLVLGIENIVI